jgi:tRNA threonylcarbamoyl adenosine modification protein (Sua5/YciO/YrdC/YwlC family)
MRVLSLDTDFSSTSSEVEKILRSGGTVVLPTDTVYGLVSLATHKQAVRNLFSIKHRPLSKPISVFISGINMAREYTVVPDRSLPLLKRVWSYESGDEIAGKVTVILPIRKPSALPNTLTSEEDTLGMRVSQNKFVNNLVTLIGEPLAQTSANISGEKPIISVEEAVSIFEKTANQPDCIVDGGTLSGVASTVIRLTDHSTHLVREGAISYDKIKNILEDAF